MWMTGDWCETENPATEDRCNPGQVSESHVNVAECPENKDRRDNEESSRNNATQSLVQKPADIGGQLLCLRARQKHAVVERVKESRFADPFLLFNQLGVHHRDLSGRPTKADETKL